MPSPLSGVNIDIILTVAAAQRMVERGHEVIIPVWLQKHPAFSFPSLNLRGIIVVKAPTNLGEFHVLA